MGKARQPWNRGPSAWKVAEHCIEITERLYAFRRSFASIRTAARLLGISTQPIRDWIRLGFLKRQGPRGQIAKPDLLRLLEWFVKHAKPFSPDKYTKRLRSKMKRPPYPFQTLSQSQFTWPKGRRTLTPRELAELIGCHPSLITKAIQQYRWQKLGKRKSAGRWEITRRAWQNSFPSSIIAKPHLSVLPRTLFFPTNETARYLSEWQMRKIKPYEVRQLVKAGRLKAIRPTVGKRKIFITRQSLQKIRNTLLTRH